jgi:hypothetical protein
MRKSAFAKNQIVENCDVPALHRVGKDTKERGDKFATSPPVANAAPSREGNA